MRKKAATVPASKVSLRKVYAVRRDGKLTRFRPSRISTHRIAENGSPNDYRSEITGEFILGTEDNGRFILEKATLEPQMILEEYNTYLELVEQEKVEQAKKENKEANDKAEIESLIELLYKVGGLTRPELVQTQWSGVRDNGPISEYYGGVRIGREVQRAVRNGLARLVAGDPIVKREIIDISKVVEETE